MIRLKLLESLDASTNRTSVWVNLGDSIFYNCGVKFSGSNVVGTLALEAFTGEGDPNVSTAAGLVAVISGSSRSVTSSTGQFYDGASGTGASWIRVNWTYTSGTGNISAWVEIKEPQDK